MRWLLGAGCLAHRGVLGLNRRNVRYLLQHNPREQRVQVDRKQTLAARCQALGLPTPPVYAVIDTYAQLGQVTRILQAVDEVVIKPDRGASGRGILVLSRVRDVPGVFEQPNGVAYAVETIRWHVAEILSGSYSLGELPDAALVQQRIHPHPMLAELCPQGVPDVRVLMYRGEPAQAMLRLPTLASAGRANLHQGGIGVGIDLTSGRTTYAIQSNRRVNTHPDSEMTLADYPIPFWQEILEMARELARALALGFLGVDIVIDQQAGPMILEANARPGLSIQQANQQGLRRVLEAIDAAQACGPSICEVVPTPSESQGSPTIADVSQELGDCSNPEAIPKPRSARFVPGWAALPHQTVLTTVGSFRETFDT